MCSWISGTGLDVGCAEAGIGGSLALDRVQARVVANLPGVRPCRSSAPKDTSSMVATTPPSPSCSSSTNAATSASESGTRQCHGRGHSSDTQGRVSYTDGYIQKALKVQSPPPPSHGVCYICKMWAFVCEMVRVYVCVCCGVCVCVCEGGGRMNATFDETAKKILLRLN